jgi:Rieske 2Fe-2S family protein
VENYNECLHCPQIHPELVQVVPLFRFGEVWDEETRDDGNWMREGATSFTMTGESELPKLPDSSRRITRCITARTSSRT